MRTYWNSWYNPTPDNLANVFGKLPKYNTDDSPDGVITETIDKVLQEDNSMEMGNFMQGMFGPIKGGLCRMTVDGNIAIKVPGGYKTYNPTQKAFINCDSFVFDIGDEMFFVIPTNTVTIGDIIMVGGEYELSWYRTAATEEVPEENWDEVLRPYRKENEE